MQFGYADRRSGAVVRLAAVGCTADLQLLQRGVIARIEPAAHVARVQDQVFGQIGRAPRQGVFDGFGGVARRVGERQTHFIVSLDETERLFRAARKVQNGRGILCVARKIYARFDARGHVVIVRGLLADRPGKTDILRGAHARHARLLHLAAHDACEISALVQRQHGGFGIRRGLEVKFDFLGVARVVGYEIRDLIVEKFVAGRRKLLLLVRGDAE